MREKYGLSGWVWILAAVVVIGFVVLGSYLVQTKQRLKSVEIELGRAKEDAKQAADQAKAEAAVELHR